MARDLYELARRDGNEISRLALLTSVLELAGEPWHGQLRQEALASARALGYGTLGAGRTLAGVAPYLPAADRDELLDRAFQMARPMQRSEAMLELVPLLPVPAQPRALAEALATARARRNTSDPRRPVGVALPPLAHLPRNALHELWAAALRDLALDPRPFFLQRLGDLAPLLDALGDGPAAASARQAVLAVTAWWP